MESGNNDPSNSTSWKVLETVLSHLKAEVKRLIKNADIFPFMFGRFLLLNLPAHGTLRTKATSRQPESAFVLLFLILTPANIHQ